MQNTETKTNKVIIELKNISKSFPGVKALDDVSMNLKQGEILGLVGENGAGKSTLIKIILGVLKPDVGEIYINGERTEFTSPRQAFNKGLNVVHQERNLIDTFTIAENIMLEKITSNAGKILNRKKLNKDAKKYIGMVGLDISPDTDVSTLSLGQQQMVEIARSLSSDSKIILLDEPTTSISIRDVELLLKIVRKLCREGYTFIFVSHKLEEIFTICDRVCILRDGKNVGEIIPTNKLDIEKLITLMIGRSYITKHYDVRNMAKGTPVLEINNLKSLISDKTNSFKLFKGEILGWYGLVGSGRSELAKQIIGVQTKHKTNVISNNKQMQISNVSDAINKLKIVYTSEDRNIEGLFLQHDIKRNISSSIWKKISTAFGFVKKNMEESIAQSYKEKLDIKTPNLSQTVINLSGGNRQKVSISKCLATEPEIIIFDEPTIGIDIKTKSDIYEIILGLAHRGVSVILITSDMAEIIKVADRILVFRYGYICDNLDNSKEYDEMSFKIMKSIMNKQQN